MSPTTAPKLIKVEFSPARIRAVIEMIEHAMEYHKNIAEIHEFNIETCGEDEEETNRAQSHRVDEDMAKGMRAAFSQLLE